MMLNSVIMYLVQSEAEIPIQPMPNTSYYIIGKEKSPFPLTGAGAGYIMKPTLFCIRRMTYAVS